MSTNLKLNGLLSLPDNFDLGSLVVGGGVYYREKRYADYAFSKPYGIVYLGSQICRESGGQRIKDSK